MAVWALGLNYNTAPLDLRGRFAFAVDRLAPVLQALRQSHTNSPEAAILSTCNRTEVYCASNAPQIDSTFDWLARAGDVPADALRKHTYIPVDNDASQTGIKKA